MSKRKFKCVSVAGNRADGIHVAAAADDGTAWIAEVPMRSGVFPQFDKVEWIQLMDLPDTEHSPVGVLLPKS